MRIPKPIVHAVCVVCASILLPGWFFASLRAETVVSAGSKDRDRLLLCINIIHGYVAEAKAIIKDADDYGRELMALSLMSYRTLPVTSAYGKSSFQAFQKALNSLDQKYRSRTETLPSADVMWNLAASELAYRPEWLPGLPYSHPALQKYYSNALFILRKMAASPFPLAGPDALGRFYPRDRSVDIAFLTAKEDLVNETIAAFMLYLDSLEAETAKDLNWTSTKPAPPEKLAVGSARVAHLYSIVSRLSDVRPGYVKRFYLRLQRIYDIFVSHYSKQADITGNASHFIASGVYWPPEWVESKLSGAQRIRWDALDIPSQRITHTYVQWRDAQWNYLSAWRSKTTSYSETPAGELYYYLDKITPIENARMQQVLDGVQDTDAVIDKIREALTVVRGNKMQWYAFQNSMYQAYYQENKRFLNELTALLEQYKGEFPYVPGAITEQFAPFEGNVQWPNYTRYAVWYLPRQETPVTIFPQPVPGAYAPVTAPDYFKLDAGKSLGDARLPSSAGVNVQYRWVVTSVPNTQNARSVKYMPFQTVSRSAPVTFKPDLAGDWQLTLIVTNAASGISNSVPVDLKFIRTVLWISHDDRETITRRTSITNDKQAKTRFGFRPYYTNDPQAISWREYYAGKSFEFPLEVAQEKAGVFSNYDDEGRPVDAASYTAPQTGFVFKMKRSSASAFVAGSYDGKYNSIDLVSETREGALNPAVYYRTLGTIELASAAAGPGSVPIAVTVLDQNIAELVLAGPDSPYALRIVRSSKTSPLSGTYSIRQWVDNCAWINDHHSQIPNQTTVKYGEAFAKRPGANGVPDWLEQEAAQNVMDFASDYLPYVERIKVTRWGLGDYVPGYREIALNPYSSYVRYNKGHINPYGYACVDTFQTAVPHLAHHAWYWLGLVSRRGAPAGPDPDADFLAYSGNASLREQLAFSWDSPANFYGPQDTGLGITYGGSSVADAARGRRKVYQKTVKLYGNAGEGFYAQFLKLTPYYHEDPDIFADTKFGEKKQRIILQSTELSSATPRTAFFLPNGKPIERPVNRASVDQVFFVQEGKKRLLREGLHYSWEKRYAYEAVALYNNFDWGGFLQWKAVPFIEITFSAQGITLLRGVPEVQVRYHEVMPHAVEEYDASYLTNDSTSNFCEMWGTILSTGCAY